MRKSIRVDTLEHLERVKTLVLAVRCNSEPRNHKHESRSGEWWLRRKCLVHVAGEPCYIIRARDEAHPKVNRVEFWIPNNIIHQCRGIYVGETNCNNICGAINLWASYLAQIDQKPTLKTRCDRSQTYLYHKTGIRTSYQSCLSRNHLINQYCSMICKAAV